MNDIHCNVCGLPIDKCTCDDRKTKETTVTAEQSIDAELAAEQPESLQG